MNAEQIEKHLEVLAEAEGGVPKLRELILQLAVMGRLVEPVTAASWKDSALNRDVRPFKVPSKWDWVTFGDVVEDISSGWSPQCENRPKAGDEWGVLKVSAVSWGQFLPDENKALPSGAQPKEHMEVRPGDLLMSRANTAELVGRSVLVETTPPRLILSDKILRISVKSNVEKEYLNMVNATRLAREYLGSRASGTSTSMRNISREVIKAMPVPLPPQSEQKQIVTRVRELMSLCDELERRQQRRHSLRRAAHTAALDALTQAITPNELARAWDRLKQNFDVLAAHSDTVPSLRQAILQLAVQGRLVNQNHSLDSVELENEETNIFSLPRGWAWTKLSKVIQRSDYGLSVKATAPSDQVPILSMSCIRDMKIWTDRVKYIHRDTKGLPALLLRKGDVLFNRTNSLELVGKSAMYDGLDDLFAFASYLIRIRVNSLVEPKYLILAMNSPYFRRTQIEPEVTQQTGQANFNGTKLSNAIIPLPPLPVQRCIIAKVEELMTLCDELERRAQAREEILSRAAQAAVAVMTGAGDGAR